VEDRGVLDRQPLPIARGVLRYRNAGEIRGRHDTAYYLFEIYLKYAAAMAMSSYLAADARDHRVNAVLKGLVRPSLGEWMRFLRECAGFLACRETPDPYIRAVAELLDTRQSRWTHVLDLYNALRAERTEKPSERTSVSAAMLLDEVVSYRNRIFGHGALVGEEQYRSFGDRFAAAFLELLEWSPYLRARSLVTFERPEVREGSRVECQVIVYMGLHPIRREEPLTLPYGAPTPREHVLHLLGDDGSRLCIDPFLAARGDDVYVLNDAGGAPEYLSYATGERYRPPTLNDAQRELFERIFGYELAPARLSRLGDDVAAPAAPAVGPEERPRAATLKDYRLVREVGRGAMGTVFEAVQESLGRRVALKLLPGTFALDPKRVERFHREARATARIHHPSIVPVYEVGEAENAHFYAMEYIDGDSLDVVVQRKREEIAQRKGRIASSAGADYITSIVEGFAGLAEGVSRAHALGLIHRDIKPSNIIVDAGGRCVLVDFGLVREQEAASLTQSGEMVGTLLYMSPEQASRRRVDARTDIYSLGASLYEALTLSHPLQGTTEADLQNAILFEDPVPPRRLNHLIAKDLETIVLHALEKNPVKRYASAGEFAGDLRRYLAGEAILVRPQSSAVRMIRLLWRRRGKVAAMLLGALVAGAAVVAWRLWPEGHLTIVDQRRVTSDSGLTTDPAASPDGALFAFASDRAGKGDLDIWIQDAAGTMRRQLTFHEAEDCSPVFSADGSQVFFSSKRSPAGLYSVPAAGGEACALGIQGQDPVLSPDGAWLAYDDYGVWLGGDPSIGRRRIGVCSTATWEPRRVAPDFLAAGRPVWAPDSRRLLFDGYGREAGADREVMDLWVASLDDGTLKRAHLHQFLAEHKLYQPRPVKWESDTLFFCVDQGDSENLWSLRFPCGTLRAEGQPRQLTTGTASGLSVHVGDNGLLLFSSIVKNSDIWSLSIDAHGRTSGESLERITRNLANDDRPWISQDGRTVLFNSPRAGSPDIWSKDLETGALERLTGADGAEIWPQLAWDGAFFVYRSYAAENSGLYLQKRGEKSGRIILDKPLPIWHLSRDGRALLYRSSQVPATLTELIIDTGDTTVLYGHPDLHLYEGHFSPDMQWVTFVAIKTTGGSSVYVAPYRPGTPVEKAEWILIMGGDAGYDKPTWCPDGTGLFVTSDRCGFMCLWRQALDPVRKTPVGDLECVRHFHTAQYSLNAVGAGWLQLSVSPRRLVFNLAELSGNIHQARIRKVR